MRTPTSGPPVGRRQRALAHDRARRLLLAARRPRPRGRASPRSAPSPNAFSILRRSLPGDEEHACGAEGGGCHLGREYVRLSSCANPRRSRHARDRRCLVGRGLQPRARGGLVRDARLRAAGAADPRGLLAHALADRRDHGDRLRRRGDQLGAVGPPHRPLRRAADAGGRRRGWSPAAAGSRPSASGAPLFLLGVAAVGLAYGLITPPTNVIVRGAPTTRHRSLLMSIKQVGVTIGGFIAGVTMPTIAHARRLAARAARARRGLRGGRAVGAAAAAARSRRTPAKGAGPSRSGSSTASCRVASRSACAASAS